MEKIRPFLWFDGCAAEAARFYVALFPGAKLLGDADGSSRMVPFELFGRAYLAFDGGPGHAFSDAMSLFVSCETQAEIDRYWDALCDGGEPIRCGWLRDRFGVTWQIVPAVLGDLLGDPDDAAAERVMDAMLGMVKLDIAGLEAARAGA